MLKKNYFFYSHSSCGSSSNSPIEKFPSLKIKEDVELNLNSLLYNKVQNKNSLSHYFDYNITKIEDENRENFLLKPSINFENINNSNTISYHTETSISSPFSSLISSNCGSSQNETLSSLSSNKNFSPLTRANSDVPVLSNFSSNCKNSQATCMALNNICKSSLNFTAPHSSTTSKTTLSITSPKTQSVINLSKQTALTKSYFFNEITNNKLVSVNRNSNNSINNESKKSNSLSPPVKSKEYLELKNSFKTFSTNPKINLTKTSSSKTISFVNLY